MYGFVFDQKALSAKISMSSKTGNIKLLEPLWVLHVCGWFGSYLKETQKTGNGKEAKNWLELKNCGCLKNIQSDLPNEARGQT